jgi:integrase
MKFTPHDCRHTFCTRFAGLTLGDVFFCQLVLGHKDLETTRAYLHLHEEIQRDVETQTAIEEDRWEVI